MDFAESTCVWVAQRFACADLLAVAPFGPASLEFPSEAYTAVWTLFVPAKRVDNSVYGIEKLATTHDLPVGFFSLDASGR